MTYSRRAVRPRNCTDPVSTNSVTVTKNGELMNDLPESFRWSYALSKQQSSAHTLASSYGDLELDDEMREAVTRALRPILERRFEEAEKRSQ